MALVIGEIITALWSQKKMIAGATLVCALAATAVTFILPNVYESSATLLLMPPGLKEWASDTKIEAKDLVGMFPKLLIPTDYAELLKQGSLVLGIADRLRAKGTYSEEDLEDLEKPSELEKRLEVDTRVAEKTAYKTEYSPVIQLIARARMPEMARDIAQAWADIAVEEAAKFYRPEGGGTVGFFTEQFEKTKTELDQVLAQMRTVETAWDEPSARRQLLEKAVLLMQLEDERARAYVDMEAARKEVEELTAALAKEKPIITLWKSPPTTALFLKESLSNPPVSAGEKTEDTKRPGYYDETLNDTYMYLQQELVSRQAALKGLEEREKSLRASIEETKKEQDALREETALYNSQNKALKQQETALTHGFQLIADGLRQAHIAETEQQRLTDLKLVAKAVVPDKKVAPLRKPTVLAAAFLGFAISCFAAMVRYRLSAAQHT